MTEPPTIEGLNEVLDDGRLWTELEFLKSRIGMTPGKLADCPVLLQLLDTADPTIAETRIGEIVQRLGDNIHAEAFAIALHLNPIPNLKKNSLVGRREWLRDYRKMKTTDSIKTRELTGQRQFIDIARTIKWTEDNLVHGGMVAYVVDGVFLEVHTYGEGNLTARTKCGALSQSLIVYHREFQLPEVGMFVLYGVFSGKKPAVVWVTEHPTVMHGLIGAMPLEILEGELTEHAVGSPPRYRYDHAFMFPRVGNFCVMGWTFDEDVAAVVRKELATGH